MAGDGRQTRHTDRDGVTVTSTGGVRTGVWLLILALALIAVMLVVVIGPVVTAPPTVAAPEQRERVAASGSAAGMDRPAARRVHQAEGRDRPPPQLPPADARSAAASDPAAVSAADHADDAAGDNAGEEPSGIALFPPPGTDPIKSGIVVPEGFELPPGYVRHYQTTDDGKQLPAILMFHPDYQPVDEHGAAIPLPENRVVPPELAPPGLAHRMLDVPDDTVPLLEGPNDRPDAN
jgi:hypothetical protein